MKLMKSTMMVMAVLGVFVIANGVFAAEAVKATSKATKDVKELVNVTGVVKVLKDNQKGKDEVTGVDLTTADGTIYSVVQNVEGKMLAKDNGQSVDVTGTVSEKEGKKWLHVKTCKVAAAPAK